MKDVKFFGISKLLIIGFVVTLISALQVFEGATWIQEYPQLVAWLGVTIGVLTFLSRIFTGKTLTLLPRLAKPPRKPGG